LKQVKEGSLLVKTRVDKKVDITEVDGIIDKHKDKPGRLLPALQELEREFGWLRPEILMRVSQRFDIAPSEVYGVASFYSLFSLKPRGRYVIAMCQDAPCHVVGAQAVMEEIEKQLGIGAGQTTPDGLFALEMASCLGACAAGPVISINGELFGNLTPEDVPAILARFRDKAASEEVHG
jgi:NADH:ubiquinone oxidoreductase subunit E